MLAAMLDIHEKRQTILVVAVEKDNLERMKQADPITLESVNADGWLPVPTYPRNLSILIAYEEDSVELYKRAKEGGPKFLQWLERNRKFDSTVDGLRHIMKVPKAGREN